MNYSLITADRTTHLKIVVLSLIAAIGVITVGLSSRLSEAGAADTRIESGMSVVKAGKPVIYTSRDTVVR